MSIFAELIEAALTEVAQQVSGKSQRKQKQDFKGAYQILLAQEQQKAAAKTMVKDDFISLENNIGDKKDVFDGKRGLIEQIDFDKGHFYDDDKIDLAHEKEFKQEQNFEVHDFSKGDDLGVGLTLSEQVAEKSEIKKHPLLEKLQNPESLRDAIIISEILRRR